MKVEVTAELRSLKKNEFKRRNGELGCDYPIMIEQDGRSYNYKATEEVYNLFENGTISKGDVFDFEAEYNPKLQWNAFVITKVKF